LTLDSKGKINNPLQPPFKTTITISHPNISKIKYNGIIINLTFIVVAITRCFNVRAVTIFSIDHINVINNWRMHRQFVLAGSVFGIFFAVADSHECNAIVVDARIRRNLVDIRWKQIRPTPHEYDTK